MRPGKLRTGIIFIGLGVALLLYNTDRLDGWYFYQLLHLWPVLLVAIGIEILARHSRAPGLGWISPLLIAATFVYAGVAGDRGWDSAWSFSFGDGHRPSRTFERTFTTDNKVDEARVYVDMYSGDLKIEGGGEAIGRGEFRSAARVLTSVSEDDHRAVVRVRQSGADRGDRARFDLALTDALPLTLDVKVDDADVALDAGSLSLETLYLDMTSGSADMILGRARDSVWASLTLGDAGIRLHVPKDAGVRFEGTPLPEDADLGSLELVSADDASETSGFKQATLKFTFRLEKPARTLHLEVY
jgi:hypothetical protein